MISRFPDDPTRLRQLSIEEAQSFVPGVVAYYQATQEEEALWVVALLLAPGLTELVTELDPEATPSLLWEWLRSAAGGGLQNPLLRVRARMINQIRERDADRANLAAYVQVATPPQMPGPRLSPQNPWLSPRLSTLWEKLTEEERETAFLVWVEGYTQAEAAQRLGISARWVRYHLTQIQKKATPTP